MNHFLAQYKDRLAVLGVGLIIIGSVTYGIVPLLHTVHKARSDIAEKNIAQEMLITRIAQKEHLIQQRDAILKNRAMIPVMPTEGQIITLIDHVERIAQERGVVIRFAALTDEAVKLQKYKNKAQKKGIDDHLTEVMQFDMEKYFIITLQGTFDDVVGMLHTLENAQYYIFMDTVTIVPQEHVQRSGDVSGVVLQVPDADHIAQASTTRRDTVIATINARIPFKEQQ